MHQTTFSEVEKKTLVFDSKHFERKQIFLNHDRAVCILYKRFITE